MINTKTFIIETSNRPKPNESSKLEDFMNAFYKTNPNIKLLDIRYNIMDVAYDHVHYVIITYET